MTDFKFLCKITDLEGLNSEMLTGIPSISQHPESVRVVSCNQEKSNLAVLRRKEMY